VFAGRSGGTTTCEHSQELTLGLLELEATGVFTALCHLWLFSRLRATPLVVGSLAMVSPGTISSVLSPTGKEVMSDAQEVRSFIGWNFFSLDVLSIWVA